MHQHAKSGQPSPAKVHESGLNLQLLLSIACGAFLVTGFGLSFLKNVHPVVVLACYIVAYLTGSFFAAREAVKALRAGGFDIDLLMLVAAAGAAILGEWSEGALLLFLFSMGNALEHMALDKARKSIESLTALTPSTALLKADGRLVETAIEALQPGHVIVVQPSTRIAADGVVIYGSSSVNQAPITGESMPADKMALPDGFDMARKPDPQYTVFAGTINGSGILEVKVTKKAADSTLARMVQMVTEAQAQKSPTQLFTDRIEKYYVPSILLLVTILCFAFVVIHEPFSASFYRAMSVLIGASPCALAISTPSAVLSGVARAARAGLLVKGGRPLEELGELKAMAFDKTGTLTAGTPSLTGVHPSEGVTDDELLKIAVAIESLSDHPLAKAVVHSGTEKLGAGNVVHAHDLKELPGMGIKAMLGEDTIYAGNLALFEKLDSYTPPDALVQLVHTLQGQGNTAMVIRRNGMYIGVITLMDAPRAEAAATLQALSNLGIEHMVMLTGDNQKVADAVAGSIGLAEAKGGLLPAQKVEQIGRMMASYGRVAMIGDGVNDAPAMAKSSVGIAMGAAGNDVALETAEVALLGDRLPLLVFAVGLGRKARSVIRQNLFISLGMVALLVPLTMLGLISLGPAVVGHEGSTVLVVLNALRLLAYESPSERTGSGKLG